MSETISQARARALWLNAQGLTTSHPFGDGAAATTKAIEHLGYVQIDTIHVIERSHHHILFTRIPEYKRAHLEKAQSKEKSIFEYWTHALSYVPTKDFRYFLPEMNRIKKAPGPWLRSVKPEELQKVLRLIKKDGAISIRDINDDVLVEKDHEWASRKPSKRALQLGFYSGRFVISERHGMLKKYELTDRHFDWDKKPKAASPKEVFEYKIDRALRAQALVSLDSICYLEPKHKAAVKQILESRVRKGQLLSLKVQGVEKVDFWISPQDLNAPPVPSQLLHILSPFDPLVIQRKRLQALFNYEHRFEAYVPKDKRKYGYFALPVLFGDQVIAALDLKTDREAGKLLIQKWSWIGKSKSLSHKKMIEEELSRFEKFQLHK